MDLEKILDRLVDTDDVDRRSTLLNQLCGDDTVLRQKVIEQLAARNVSVNVVDFPSRPGHDFTTAGPVSTEPEIGASFGRYQILEHLGEGGMGIVYLAQQAKPVRRRVAIKITKTGMNSPELVARFQAERQALALMDHDNIAKVLDAGTTDDGRMYFVMELVKGLPISEYCDRQRMSTDERLELFIAVCQAIQHAHQKGIVHRDIKPSNVLVSDHNGRPVAKVIDFGLAKALEQQLTPHTLYTQFGQVLGTLEYMSPEQANFGAMDVDTRTDVYSLGVLLYEMLTGTTPLANNDLQSAPLDEVLKIIRDVEPPRPSTRLLDTTATPADAAGRQATDLRRLRERLRGDLDAIVLKALEKDRNRRYASAAGLAADVSRHLRDEPIEARPPSALYLMRKFTRRHRALVMSMAAVLVALAIGISFSTYFAFQARHAAAQTASQAQLAQEQRDIAVQTLRDVVFQIQVPLLEIPAARDVRQQMLEEAISGLRRVAEGFDNDTTSNRVMMVALEDLGDIFLSLGPDADAALEMDHRAFAELQYRRAKEIAEQNLAEAPDDPVARYDMFIALGRQAMAHASLGKQQQAAENGLKAAKIIAELAEQDPQHYLGAYFNSAYSLSGVLFTISELDKALEWTARGLEIAERVSVQQLELSEPISADMVEELKLRREVFRLLPSVMEDEGIALKQRPRIKHRLLIDRAKHFLDQGNHVKAASALNTLLQAGDLTARDYYGAACRYAKCANLVLGEGSAEELDDASSALHESHSEMAVELLRKAYEAGLFDSIWMGLSLLNSDSDLDPIRHRADFLEFVEELKQDSRQ